MLRRRAENEERILGVPRVRIWPDPPFEGEQREPQPAHNLLVVLCYKETIWCRIVLWVFTLLRQAHSRSALRHTSRARDKPRGTPTGSNRSSCTARDFCFPVNVRASNLWPRGWPPTTCGECTSRCIIWLPMLHGMTMYCCAKCVMRLFRRCRSRTPAWLGSWTIQATPASKKGRHSVGVGRQYCGQIGKQENCQVAVSLSVSTWNASLPIAYRLYLPEEWAKDTERRNATGVPQEIQFQTKPQIALDQIQHAVKAEVARGVVLADAGYGADGQVRAGLTELGLPYVVGVQSTMTVWEPGDE